MEVLALDVGAARVGIARASSLARLAVPLKTVKTTEALDELLKMIKETDVEAIVVGLPRNLSAQDTQQTRWVRQWVKQAKKQISLPFYWQDEALTTREANNNKRAIKKHGIDAVAASLILQDFLDTPADQRVVC